MFTFYQVNHYKKLFDQFLVEHPSRLTVNDLYNLLPLFGPARTIPQCDQYISKYSATTHSPPSLDFDDFIHFLTDYEETIENELEKIRILFQDFSRRYGRGVGKEAFLKMIKAGNLPITSSAVSKDILSRYFKSGNDTISAYQFVDIVKSNTAWIVDQVYPIAVEGSLKRRIDFKVFTVCNLDSLSFTWPFPYFINLKSLSLHLKFYLAGSSVSSPVVLSPSLPNNWEFNGTLSFELPAKMRMAQNWIDSQRLIVRLYAFCPLTIPGQSNSGQTSLSHSELLAEGELFLNFIMLDCSHMSKVVEVKLHPCFDNFGHKLKIPLIRMSIKCDCDDVVERRQVFDAFMMKRYKNKISQDLNITTTVCSDSELLTSLDSLITLGTKPAKGSRDRDKMIVTDNIRNVSLLLNNCVSRSALVYNFESEFSKYFPLNHPRHPENLFSNTDSYPSTFFSFYSTFIKEIRQLIRRNFQILGLTELNQFLPIFCFISPIDSVGSQFRTNEPYNVFAASEMIARLTTDTDRNHQSIPNEFLMERHPHLEQIRSPATVFATKEGSMLDKSIFLCSLFLGLKIDAYVASGIDFYDNFVYWVITLDSQVLADDGSKGVINQLLVMV
ncbi:hypothetical protein GEMRC1_008512 [Eukaryota sp. GEM-RC1]